LEMTPLRLVGDGTDVTLAGEYEMESGAYRFTAQGTAPLGVAAAFWPGLFASGTGDFSLSLHGTQDRSEWEGWAALRNGRLQGGGLPLPISSLAGRVVLDPSGRFTLDGVSFVAGGGTVTLTGGGRLEGFRPEGLEIGVSGSDVAIQAPQGFRGRY